MKLYDTPADIASKALRGLALAPSTAADKAGLTHEQVKAFLDGDHSTATASRLAAALGLDPEALANLPGHAPSPPLPPGLSQLVLPFDDEEVNAWLIERDGVAVVIDAGSGPHDLAAALEARHVDRFHLLITHTHPDHIGGIGAVGSRLLSLRARSLGSAATEISPGDRLEVGPLKIDVLDLAGHHPEALGLDIEGIGLAVGDAVFAGSVGGCPGPPAYATARRTIEAALTHRPDETLLLTGHGPATTLAAERIGNPFLAAWLKPG